MSPDSVAAASRASIANGSKSFAAAARLFDPVTRDSARHFYAWCRHCDDVIDGQVLGFAGVGGRASFETPPSAALQDEGDWSPALPRSSMASGGTRPTPPLMPRSPAQPGVSKRDGGWPPASPAERLALLERQTRDALAGVPQTEPAFAALARVALRHRLPEHVPLDILAGFRMDVDNHTYATLDDLLVYCYGVAGAVGLGMAIIMGVEPGDRATLDRACDLGLAFQLTNIARDVMDDARAGRVYLPADLFRRDAATPDFILDARNRAAVIAATHALLELAERYYASARIGIARLPWRSAWAVATALGVYRDIGRRVRAAPDPWAERQRVPGWRKLAHVGTAAGAPLLTRLRLDPDAPRAGLWTRHSA